MSFDITDRGIKLLYRQRGSHLRRIDGEIGPLFIEQTSSSPPRAEAETDEIFIEDEVREDREPERVREDLEREPGLEPELMLGSEPVLEPEPVLGSEPVLEPEPVSGSVLKPEPELDPSLAVPSKIDQDISPTYHFQNIPQRQLSCSITSITSIESIKAILGNLLEKELIPQAKVHFESDKNRESKMKHKLDIRIFQLVFENLNSDLRDILDINISNNQLLYQLRQLTMAREELNQQLIQTRSELQELKCGGDWHKLQSSRQALQSRLGLNEKLNALAETIQSRVPPQSRFDKCPKYDIEDLCELLNPHTGLLNCLQK